MAIDVNLEFSKNKREKRPMLSWQLHMFEVYFKTIKFTPYFVITQALGTNRPLEELSYEEADKCLNLCRQINQKGS